MMERSTSESTIARDWLELPPLEASSSNISSDTISSDSTTTPQTSASASVEKPYRSAKKTSPTEAQRSSQASEYTPFITLTSTGGTLSESLGGATSSNQTHSSPVTASATGTTTTRSPTSTSSGFFANFRPSSPKVQQPYASTSTTRDEIASFYSSAIGRKGAIERERDMSQSSSDTSTTRNRRPSSVFDHVGGMLDRFGRRLQSRGEADRRRMSNSVNGLNESAVDIGESGSSVDDHSPNENIPQMSPNTNLPPTWERSAGGGGGPGLSWSPVMDEGHRSRPDMTRRDTASSNGEGSSSRLGGQSSLHRPAHRLSVMERTLVQVTEDNERFSVVDISGLNSAAAIKERMMSKLHRFEEDPSCFAMSKTEIGLSGPGGPMLSNDELLALCWQEGDERGSLKFLVHQVSPPSHANQSMLPPPRYSNPTPLLGLHENGTVPAPALHSKSGSFSSRSSMGDAQNQGDSAHTGDSGSEASGRMGILHRTKATSRRANGASSTASNDDNRSPIVSTRSPSQPTTPLLASVLESETGEKDSTAKRPIRPERSDKRQSPLDSPIEELDESTLRSSDVRRSGQAGMRPSSSHTALRTSLHSQHESEPGQRSSQGSSAAFSSPTMSKTDLPERRSSDKMTHQQSSTTAEERGNGISQLPKSLQPGGRDPRGIDAADAAHMYLGGASSPLEGSAYNVHSPANAREGGTQSQQQQQQQAQAIHNARSIDDMARRSRAAMQSSMQEMPALNREQPGQRPATASASSIIRQGSADANTGHRPQHPYGQHDPRDPRFSPTTGMVARPRTSTGSERERAVSYAESPYQHSMHMMGRPASSHANGVDAGRNVRPGMMASPPMARPMTPVSLRPLHQDHRSYGPAGQANFRPVHYMNEFGARVPMSQPQGPHPHMQQQGFHPSDPRLISPPFAPPRPLTLHDHQRFRPLPPGYIRPPSQQHREDPFINSQFPASNARTVSEFQRNPNSALQPGMTVQETMTRQRQLVQAHSAQQLRGVDPRETRSMSARPMYPPHPSPYQGPVSAPPTRPPVQLQQIHYQQHHHNQPTPDNHRPVRQQPPPQSRPSNSKNPPNATPLTRPHTAALDQWEVPPNERSSGSSFATVSSSHKRNLSSEDRHSAGWIEEPYSAPTSARTSRSESMEKEKESRLQVVNASESQASSPVTQSELPYSNYGAQEIQRRRSMPEEDDLSNLRPLPKLPPLSTAGVKADGAKSASATEGRKEDESNTIRASEWKQMMISLEAEGENEDSGTARASDFDKSKQSATSETKALNAIVPPSAQANTSIAGAEDGGTFASFASFDDEEDYDEGGTWAQPLDKLPAQSKAESQTPVDNGAITMRPSASLIAGPRSPNSPHSPRALAGSPRRPILTLSINPSVHGSPSQVEAVSPKNLSTKIDNHLRPVPARESPQTKSILAMPSPASTDIHRRTSFARREVDWAFRPPPEQLYDNLDAFFPKHDLDKPVLDNAAPGSPPALSPKTEMRTSSPAPLSSNRARFTHKKSIRIVAQDRKKFLERADASERRKVEDEGLNRRRSTKLWGTTVVEVTPGSASSASGVDSPSTEAGARPVFKWVKGDLIGKGTYGRVYLALNATTGEMIAVKQVELPMTDSDREDARQKGVVSALKSEIETLKDLDHPNIVSYLGFEETTRYLSIFLEYVPGGSVGSCLRKHGKLDEATIKSFLQQILVGLNYLHKRGILHRDLKADNLLVDFNGIVKISDFGTVRKSEDIYGNIASMSIQGSIFWMAPEVVSLSRAGYSAKVDIWSLGCVVLEMFAGRRPWSDEEAVQAMFKIGAERKPPPIPPDAILSRPATHFLKVCFAVDPASRPTAQRLLEHVFPHTEPNWSFSESSLYKALHR